MDNYFDMIKNNKNDYFIIKFMKPCGYEHQEIFNVSWAKFEDIYKIADFHKCKLIWKHENKEIQVSKDEMLFPIISKKCIVKGDIYDVRTYELDMV